MELGWESSRFSLFAFRYGAIHFIVNCLVDGKHIADELVVRRVLGM
jgi:hypothetical protein